MQSKTLNWIERTLIELGIENIEPNLNNTVYINTEESDLLYESQFYIDKSINYYGKEELESKNSLMSLIQLYGITLGGMRLKNTNEIVTHQSKTKEEKYWIKNLDPLLNKISNSYLQSIGNIIEWCCNPMSNIEIANDVYKRIFYAGINEMIRRGFKNKKINLIIPPISLDLKYPKWENVFMNSSLSDLDIHINNFGVFLDETCSSPQFIVIEHKDDIHHYAIVSVYKKWRNQLNEKGTICIDLSNDCTYELHSTKSQYIRIEKRAKINKVNKKNENKPYVSNLICKYEEQQGLISFLSLHHHSFIEDVFEKTNKKDDLFKEAFKINSLLKISEIASYLTEENNLNNIALNDVIYLYNELSRDDGYKQSRLDTKSKSYLEGSTQYDDLINTKNLKLLPANFGNVSWRLKNSKIDIIDYSVIDNTYPLEQKIMSVIKYYRNCTTETIAEEILFFENDDTNAIPTALFTAKIYTYISNMTNVVISQKDDIIDDTFLTVKDNSKIITYVDKNTNKAKVNKKQKSGHTLKTIRISSLNISPNSISALEKRKIFYIQDLINYHSNSRNDFRFLSRGQRDALAQELRKYQVYLKGL